jgi:hypothetical protein
MTQQTPTQKIQNWINNFVSQPNAVFGNLPPCPFARKAIVDNKVEFQEMIGTTDYATLYQTVFNFDWDNKDVLCMILPPNHFTATETTQMAKDLNSYFMTRDVVILEDHPDIDENVQGVKLNNGEYILFLAQSLSKLNHFSRLLESGPYYKNWSKSYLQSVKGFRENKTP